MTCVEVLERLQAMSSEKYKANVVRLGIPEENSIGVSTGDIRKLAREIGKSPQLAEELWNTGYHEARLLAVLLLDKKHADLADAERWMADVHSWDLCDHLCKNLIIKLNGYERLIDEWMTNSGTYYKRGAFTLIASAATHEKSLSEEDIRHYLELIRDYSDDEREHVKKAASWALREIGKIDFDCQEKAILLACELKECGEKARMWIGKDAYKELEKLVQTEGRRRLISSDSKMGREV